MDFKTFDEELYELVRRYMEINSVDGGCPRIFVMEIVAELEIRKQCLINMLTEKSQESEASHEPMQ